MEKLLLIDDEPGIRTTIQSILQSDELQVFEAADAAEGLHLMKKECPPIVMLDICLGTESGLDLFEQLRSINPRVLVIFITGHGTSETAIETMKLGAYDYLVKPLDLDVLSSTVEQARKICRQMYTPAAITMSFQEETGSDLLVGSGPAMQSVCKQIGRVAPQDVNVLILGESGTGKELIARAIYQHSRRSQAPFLAINCAAIPETLLESSCSDTKREPLPVQITDGSANLNSVIEALSCWMKSAICRCPHKHAYFDCCRTDSFSVSEETKL